MAHVRSFQTGPRSEFCQLVLKELASARLCLLDLEKKTLYDQQIRTDRTDQNVVSSGASHVSPPTLPLVAGDDSAAYRLVPLEPVATRPLQSSRVEERQRSWKRSALGVTAFLLLAIVMLAIAPAVWRLCEGEMNGERPQVAGSPTLRAERRTRLPILAQTTRAQSRC